MRLWGWSVLGVLVMSGWACEVASQTNRQSYDVVVLKNGDIYNGTVANPSFDFATPYGEISIPYGMMKSLEIGTVEDQVITHEGERFTGTLLNDEMQMLRVLDPSLTLYREDISTIQFAKRPTRMLPTRVTDQLWMRDGDRMLAQILTTDFMLKVSDGLKIIPRDSIHVMEVEPTPEGDRQRVLVRTNTTGEIVTGELLTQQITLRTRFGTPTELPTTQLALVGIGVNYGPGPSGYFPKPWLHRRSPAARELRDQLADRRWGPELVVLRGGSFERGSVEGDTDERPPTRVVLKPFAIGIHEITFDEYDHYCARTRSKLPDDQGWGRGLRPVINVSWEDAKRYTEWLSEQTGNRYRLPTDAEWEYATRAGSRQRFWWGDTTERAQANCEGCGSLWDGEKSAPVGRFPPNGFGLHDTAGNVWEWMEDCYSDSFAKAPADGKALQKPGCGKRVIRGGAWSFPPQEMRSANRWRDFPARRSDDTGFRVVRVID